MSYSQFTNYNWTIKRNPEIYRKYVFVLFSLLPEIRQIVYCNGVHYGHPDLWDELLTIYGDNWHSGPDANERIRMRNALTCSNNRWVLERLELCLRVEHFCA